MSCAWAGIVEQVHSEIIIKIQINKTPARFYWPTEHQFYKEKEFHEPRNRYKRTHKEIHVNEK